MGLPSPNSQTSDLSSQLAVRASVSLLSAPPVEPYCKAVSASLYR